MNFLCRNHLFSRKSHKMSSHKNHLTVTELQQICERLGLSTDGLKHELIERMVNFTPTEISADTIDSQKIHSPVVSNIRFTRTRITPIQSIRSSDESSSLDTNDQSTHTPNILICDAANQSKSRFQKFYQVFLVIVPTWTVYCTSQSISSEFISQNLFTDLTREKSAKAWLQSPQQTSILL